MCPNALLAATGISMGGLILGNYISSHKDASKFLSAAMLISVPWNVFKGTVSIERPVVNLLLNRHLASCLCNIIRGVREVVEPKLGADNINNILKSKTIKEFDSLYTCKQFGYDSVEAYYSAATLHNKVHQINVPTLCLNAADDPFQPYDGIPVNEVNKSPNVCIVITPRGGHIGFMEGVWPLSMRGRRQYMFELFAQYFRSALHKPKDFALATEKVRTPTQNRNFN
ncbi:Abhydrolase domain containing [Nesidiocoris tenuis]|uniref:Abhydrolase domain containing n=1 Tax=Nesidiocoris tenuis TaxID=355587 RepID=A0ABN7BI67_9HEMI|nr:Abhydrolase domain containing [Nesidiocoris tenuis]